MSGRLQFLWVSDPRCPGADDCLGAYFAIQNAGEEPHGYGRDFDPGCGPEFSVSCLVNEAGARIDLSDAQISIVEKEIVDRFDFHAALRADRERDADLCCLRGVL